MVAEARELVAGGAKEIMLLGQNVAAYGWGGNVNPPPAGVSPFAELLEELDRIPGLLRIRFTSPYPTYFNDRLIAAIAPKPDGLSQYSPAAAIPVRTAFWRR